jgi:DNA helicase-2/ATP-dependent DNA helicase PcrA
MPQSEGSNPAIEASERAFRDLKASIAAKHSFVLEAGAGAGKTYSLVHVLRSLVEEHKIDFPRSGRKIACITFTNVAKDEIEARTDRNPIIYCDTIHGFCWSIIGPYQSQMREIIPTFPVWSEKLAEAQRSVPAKIEYSFGYRALHDDSLSLGHDDVLPLTVSLMKHSKFRNIFSQRYPIVLIDEYQDTNAEWVDNIKSFFLGEASAPLFGFFGDHWQKIYEGGCGKIEHPNLVTIGKQANFRSVQTIVDCLNRMRPELPQFAQNPKSVGDVRIFHTNAWHATRRQGAHWGGDLPEDLSRAALDRVERKLSETGWDFSPTETKILMLTHRAIAAEQGYSSLPSVFQFNESFTKKENKLIGFLVDALEPACDAFVQKKYGEMFAALGSKLPPLRSRADKRAWSESMDELTELRKTGTVGDVVAHLRSKQRPRLPDAVEQLELELDKSGTLPEGEISRNTTELRGLHQVPYAEIMALRAYHAGFSPFETNHGVKGAEFENVLVVVGRGWSRYNFGEMLEWAGPRGMIPAKSQNKFEQNRNLFYVACSRPKIRLAILFTQLLSPAALSTVQLWFSAQNVIPLPQS